MSNPKYLYRVVVTAYPEGSLVPDPSDPTGDTLIPREGWAPPGWRPEGRYVELLGTSEFVWPKSNETYMSRSTARRRADLFVRCGATAHVERSNRIIWPDNNTEERAA